MYEAGKDGKELPAELAELIKPLLQKEVKKYDPQSGPEPKTDFWNRMCRYCAEYAFVGFDQHILSYALYGIYRTFVPEKERLVPFDDIIQTKLIEACSLHEPVTNSFHYGIKSDGLNGKVVIRPPEGAALGWLGFADQVVSVFYVNFRLFRSNFAHSRTIPLSNCFRKN